MAGATTELVRALRVTARDRDHVVIYLRAWADLLEAALPARAPRLVA